MARTLVSSESAHAAGGEKRSQGEEGGEQDEEGEDLDYYHRWGVKKGTEELQGERELVPLALVLKLLSAGLLLCTRISCFGACLIIGGTTALWWGLAAKALISLPTQRLSTARRISTSNV